MWRMYLEKHPDEVHIQDEDPAPVNPYTVKYDFFLEKYLMKTSTLASLHLILIGVLHVCAWKIKFLRKPTQRKKIA